LGGTENKNKGERAVTIAEAGNLCAWSLELSDEVIARRVVQGEGELYEILIRRHNPRLYRIARSILRDEAEAEDVMQDAYLSAYAHLDQFEGRASFKTWISRIAMNEALARLRRNGRYVEWDETMNEERANGSPAPENPEQELSRRELSSILEEAIDSIPVGYRLVFVLRQLDGMSTDEVAQIAGISSDNVKARFRRAKIALRKVIESRVGAHGPELFAFHLSRCDRIVERVRDRLCESERRSA
jgi:RNA polymerase sigma-70 factor (ECF subfamily)